VPQSTLATCTVDSGGRQSVISSEFKRALARSTDVRATWPPCRRHQVVIILRVISLSQLVLVPVGVIIDCRGALGQPHRGVPSLPHSLATPPRPPASPFDHWQGPALGSFPDISRAATSVPRSCLLCWVLGDAGPWLWRWSFAGPWLWRLSFAGGSQCLPTQRPAPRARLFFSFCGRSPREQG
jgi:hypothetical protein